MNAQENKRQAVLDVLAKLGVAVGPTLPLVIRLRWWRYHLARLAIDWLVKFERAERAVLLHAHRRRDQYESEDL